MKQTLASRFERPFYQHVRDALTKNPDLSHGELARRLRIRPESVRKLRRQFGL